MGQSTLSNSFLLQLKDSYFKKSELRKEVNSDKRVDILIFSICSKNIYKKKKSTDYFTDSSGGL